MPIKSEEYFCATSKIIFKCIWKIKGQDIFEEGHCRGIVLPNTKAYYKTVIVNECDLGKRMDKIYA